MGNESCKPNLLMLWPALDLAMAKRLDPPATADVIGRPEAQQRAMIDRHWNDLQNAFLPDEHHERVS